MSLLGRIFPAFLGPEAKIDQAKAALDKGEFNDARWILGEVQHPEAESLLAQALAGLVEMNLEEARARYSSGDRAGAEEHLGIAREFGATSEQLRGARKAGRADMPAPPPKKQVEPTDKPVGEDPLWSLPPTDPRLRYALTVETYPESLRERLVALGPEFAAAVLRIDDGDAASAVTALTAFVHTDPVARYERARAALAAEQRPAAASDLLAFGDAVGHQQIGQTHTLILLSQVLISLGRAEEALERVDLELEKDDRIGLRIMAAHLLFVLGRDEEADEAATQLLREASRDMGLVRLLARIRVRRGERISAMGILEDGLNRCCSAPGKCGSQPLDLEAVRLLVQLYLEDRIEPGRVAELLRDLQRHVSRPGWEDAYIAALVARNEGHPGLEEQVAKLGNGLKPGHPGLARLKSAFGYSPPA